MKPQFFFYPGAGAAFREHSHYSQSLRLGDVVHISGQGGWGDDLKFPADLEAEVERAADNVAKALADAGATWADVVAVDSFHVPLSADEIGEEHLRPVSDQFRRRMGDRAPVWTATGVPALGAPGMRVEIRVTAIAPAGSNANLDQK